MVIPERISSGFEGHACVGISDSDCKKAKKLRREEEKKRRREEVTVKERERETTTCLRANIDDDITIPRLAFCIV